MKLLFDIGNTFLKWALYEEEKCLQHDRFLLNINTLTNDLSELFKKVQKPDAVLLSNVNNADVGATIQRTIQEKWALSIWQATTSAIACGIENAYARPETLGIDRWLAMLGAKQYTSNGYCVVDCGSAITIDYVTQYGIHKGGFILPGLMMMQKALISNTAKLNYDENDDYALELAQDTSVAIKNGCFLAVIATINKACTEIAKQFDSNIDFFITGGDAESLIAKGLETNFEHQPNLVFDGLLNLHAEKI